MGELFDPLLQGVKDGNTAHQALLLAELADDKLVSPAVRAALIVTLAEAGTIGQRDAAIDPDGYANADMVLLAQVREAVQEAAASLFADWEDEPEVVRFALAVLAAACTATDRVSQIGRLQSEQPVAPRAATLALASALAADHEVAIVAALGDLAEHPDDNPDALGAPEAPVQGRGLSLLIDLAQQEIGPLVFD